MKTREDIESYLIRAELPHEVIGDGLWVIGGTNDVERIVVKFQPPVLVCRVKVMDVPAADREELYRTLLELNATEMMHGAYGIENGAIVIADALQLENLDFNEFQASVDALNLSITTHYRRLAPFLSRGPKAKA